MLDRRVDLERTIQVVAIAVADVDGQQHWQQRLEKEEEEHHQILQRTRWWQEQGLQLQYTKLWSTSCVVVLMSSKKEKKDFGFF